MPRKGSRSGIVLIVDDDRETLESLSSLAELDAPDVRILGASCAEEALEILREKSISGIVADMNMPGMDGLTFLNEAHRRSPGTRLALASASAVDDLRELASNCPLDEVIGKPFSPDQFVRLVRRLAHPGPPVRST